jgi:hypothetical protein
VHLGRRFNTSSPLKDANATGLSEKSRIGADCDQFINDARTLVMCRGQDVPVNRKWLGVHVFKIASVGIRAEYEACCLPSHVR